MVGAWIVSVVGLGIDPGIFIANIKAYIQPMDFWMGIIKAAVFADVFVTSFTVIRSVSQSATALGAKDEQAVRSVPKPSSSWKR